MCGIDGFVTRRRSSAADLEHVLRMDAALRHRGPDAGGTADLGFGVLGMRRLAIVDVAGGQQPLRSADGRFTLVYNGEVYDHAALRRELEAGGARFSTASDTEVVLQAWAARGEAALDALNGMFAFALADRDERSLVLARDPLGIKPLYYHLAADGELVFSSELRALVAHPRVPRVLDRRSLATLLVDRCVGDPWTLFDGIHRLPPGHLLRWRDGRVELRRWYRYEPLPEDLGEREALAELERLLEESVRAQLVADVPVGVLLSGGVDSSTVAAYAAAARAGAAPLKSFSVGFAHPGYDESALAREVARHLGTEHHEVRIEDAGFEPAVLERIVDHVGQPLADLSCIPTWAVSRLAREHVKVVLSGDGGDELFGGYDHVRWAARVERAAGRAPAALRRVAQGVLAGVAPLPLGNAGAARRLRKGLALTFHEPRERLRRLMALWSPEEAEALAGVTPRPAEERSGAAPGTGARRLAPEEAALAELARTYLPAAILAKVDHMSMAASLEVRVPLLDRRIVALAARLPLGLKLRGRNGKHLLREAGRARLPRAVHRQRKRGFTLPLAAWLTPGFWGLLEGLYAPGRPAAELFERRAVEAIVAEARRAGTDEGRISAQGAATRAWLLALVGTWLERFGVTA